MKTTDNKIWKAGLYLILFILISGMQPAENNKTNDRQEVDHYLTGLPFKMPSINLPVFLDYSVNIIDFGAVGDGIYKNTEAFAKAIEACSVKGGGIVNVSPGIWYTGPIEFKSNINLHLEKGALVIFSRDHADYPIIKVPGSKKMIVAHPVYGFNLENIAITGEGIMDGSGETWRPVKKMKTTESQWKKLTSSGGLVNPEGNMYWPTKEAMDGEAYMKTLENKKDLTVEDYLPARDFLRPNMVVFYYSKKILIDGPTIQNSPKFTINPQFCEDVVMRNLKVLNEWWAQNGDGIDISSCRNVLIYNCLVNAGDDGICMKSSSRKSVSGASLQNVVISDCVVYHGHGGFVIGSNTDGGMRNIYVNNCNFIGTDIGLRFKSGRGRGGQVDSIFVNNIFMKDIVEEAVLFDTYYNSDGEEDDTSKQEVNERTPVFEKFFISNLYCDGATQAIKLYGLPEMPIRQIEFKNVVISSEKGFVSKDAMNIKMKDVTILPKEQIVFSIKNSSGFDLNNISFPDKAELFMKVTGKNNDAIKISGTNLQKALKQFEFIEGADKKAIIVK